MGERKKQFEKTVSAIGFGSVITGATFGLYCYLKSKSRNEARQGFRKPQQHSFTENCSICYEAMSSKLTSLGCNHTFHTLCIVQWSSKHNTCPICRTPF